MGIESQAPAQPAVSLTPRQVKTFQKVEPKALGVSQISPLRDIRRIRILTKTFFFKTSHVVNVLFCILVDPDHHRCFVSVSECHSASDLL